MTGIILIFQSIIKKRRWVKTTKVLLSLLSHQFSSRGVILLILVHSPFLAFCGTHIHPLQRVYISHHSKYKRDKYLLVIYRRLNETGNLLEVLQNGDLMVTVLPHSILSKRQIYPHLKPYVDSTPKFMECITLESDILHSFNQELNCPFCCEIRQVWQQFLTDHLGIRFWGNKSTWTYD